MKGQVVRILYRFFLVLFILCIFLLSLYLLGGGFKLMSEDILDDIFKVTNNPVAALFIGLFATALVQSSSTTTSIIVTLVASGALSLPQAVPMIMGANIGTSVTSTIVAIGHVHNKDEFKNAISAATVHDFFNILVVLVLLPFELLTGYISSAAVYLSSMLPIYEQSTTGGGLMGSTLKPLAAWFIVLSNENVWLILGLAILLLVSSLRGFTIILRRLIIGKSQEVIDTHVFGHPMKSLFWGMAITAGVQSSSVTASLAVPLVASNRATLQKVFPFLIGANVGTTFTALFAALSQNEIALSIALCHVLFNLVGVLIFFPVKQIRNVPVRIAEWLGHMSFKNRLYGILYVITLFFVIPLLVLSF